MSEELSRLRLAAVNIDGVLLDDTFSPMLHRFVTGRGGAYTAELERRVFSQPRLVAGQILAEATGMETGPQETVDIYLREREEFLLEHPVRTRDGAVELLERLRGLGLRTVCYGGLDHDHFHRELGPLADLFDAPGYVCTNDFRPGVREISEEIFHLPPERTLFIDDVARVAEEARRLSAAFIGAPSSFEHGFQPLLMREVGVRHVVTSVVDIDEALLRAVDAEAAAGTHW
ncbi:HAD family phosphatase [Streptomyces sp. NPDC000594]|uniref:HAD family phosphatase n=1 Tax=Streptomyces sp. NPDC000594 TaxID=3154261 RepID=UPI0033309DAB